jgi:hypothetical protein
MPYMHMLSDPGMNYTLNRPLLDGTSPARIKEIGAVAPQIKDYESWHAVWLGLAKRAEAEQRWLDAASYYHGAEFYLPAGEVRNGLYDDFARNWALGMKGVAGYERIEVPYPGGHLPGFRLQAKGKELSTFIFNGGYDSFVEEFYGFLLPLTDFGFTVIGFDGPGRVERCDEASTSSTPGRSRPRRCSTISSSTPPTGWALPAAAISLSGRPRSSRGSSTSFRCPRHTQGSI